MSRRKRSFSEKVRNKQYLNEKPMIIITAEGRNETEVQYFDSFRTADCPYLIKIHKAGHVTNPAKLAESIRKRWESEDADVGTGDMAFVIVDLDNKESRAKEVRQLQTENAIESYIVSNPCFEVWFLLHYDYSTRAYLNANAVIKELKKHYKGYEKKKNMFPVLKDKINTAVENAEKLEGYHRLEEHLHPDVKCNPYTDVHKLVKMLVNKEEEIVK